MRPFFAHGDTILVNIFSYIFHDPSIGDVVVLRSPTDMMVIKRITRRKNNLYFVRGDNQKESTDSRVFGWIERKEIAGKVLLKISH